MIHRKEIQDVTDAVIERIEEFETEYRSYSENSIDHFAGKADTMSTAKTIVKAAFSDLLKNNAEDKSQIIIAYMVLRENCRAHHSTCEGCPLYKPEQPKEPSGIPSKHCLIMEAYKNNEPPAAWRDIEGGAED